jgi:hypothetical protein
LTDTINFSSIVVQSPISENTTLYPQKKKPVTSTKKLKQPQPRKNAKVKDAIDQLQIAQQAAALAAKALQDQGFARRLLSSLIVTRDKPGGSNWIELEKLKSTRADANAATADNPF